MPGGSTGCLFGTTTDIGKYARALEVVEQINMPHYPWTYAGLAIAHAQLGNGEAAKKHLDDFLRLSSSLSTRPQRIDLRRLRLHRHTQC